MLVLKLSAGAEIRIIHNGEHIVIKCAEAKGSQCKIAFPSLKEAPGWQIYRESLYQKLEDPSVPVRAEPVGGQGES